jgi:tetratricopeptide (TPR) repeat protein
MTLVVRLLPAVLVAALLVLGGAASGADDPAVAEGLALLERQEYGKAARLLEGAVARERGSARAWSGLGRAWLGLGIGRWGTNLSLVAKGAEALRQARDLAPGDGAVRYDLGMALLALGDREGAAAELPRLQELDPALAARLARAVADFTQAPSFRAVGDRSGGTPAKTARQGGPGDGSVTPVEIVSNVVFVPVTLTHGSRSIQARLILDTGANVTTISPEIAAGLDLHLDQAVLSAVQVVGGGMVEARGVRLQRLAVGPHERDGMNVAVITTKGAILQYDGLLGMDFLRGLHYRLDFNDRVIRWLP